MELCQCRVIVCVHSARSAVLYLVFVVRFTKAKSHDDVKKTYTKFPRRNYEVWLDFIKMVRALVSHTQMELCQCRVIVCAHSARSAVLYLVFVVRYTFHL